MSCPNFSLRHNTQKIYAFCLHNDFTKYFEELREDNPEIEEDEADAYFYGWEREEEEYYTDWIKEAVAEHCKDATVYTPTDRRPNRRDASIICTVSRCFRFAGDNYHVSVDIIAENGHYEGWTADFDEYEVPDTDELAWEMHYTQNEGLCRALAPKLQKRLQKTYEELTEQIEAALDQVAPHKLVCMGVFSNGEAIYRDTTQPTAA